jgi:hypothetical protein
MWHLGERLMDHTRAMHGIKHALGPECNPSLLETPGGNDRGEEGYSRDARDRLQFGLELFDGEIVVHGDHVGAFLI